MADDKISAEELLELYLSQDGKCNYFDFCRNYIEYNKHLDHIQPLSKGGRHVLGNVQYLCPTCNLSKQARDEKTFVEAMMLQEA